MKKAIKTKPNKNVPKIFWMKSDGRNYRLVDSHGNPLRELPRLERKVFDYFKGEKEIPHKEVKDGIQIWMQGQLDYESVTAPVWKEGQDKPGTDLHTGMAPTEVTIKSAEELKDSLMERYEKRQRQEEKKKFQKDFEIFFAEETKDKVSIFWAPEEHPSLRGWREYMDTDKYLCFMNSDVETDEYFAGWDTSWGIIIRKEIVQNVQQRLSKILYLKAPESVMTKVRDAMFIGAMKRKLGLEFIRVNPV